MRRIRVLKISVLALLLMLCASSSSIFAEEVETSGYASVDLMSNYVWRGQKVSNSWVVQPSAGITYGSFDANIWANYDSDSKIDEGDGHGELTETDLTLSYSHSIDKLTIGFGYIYYALNNANDTQEIYFSAGYDTLLKPTLTLYYDFDEGNGAFIIASIGHTFDVSKGMNLNLGASASYNINNKVMGFDSNGDDFSNFYNGEISSLLNIPIYKAITLTPKIAYSFPLSNDAKEAIKKISDDGDKEIFYSGINLTLSF
jgi:hypothetical protein